MAKTDKELTVEVVCTFLNSWNGKNTTIAISTEELADLIKTTYNVIRDLPE